MRKLKLLLLGAMLLSGQLAWSQTKSISGKATDSKDGTPLPGVSVLVKGTASGTVTGSDGTFTLAVPEKTSALIFSYLGYSSKEVAITGSLANVSLEISQTKSLDEVVVVGYGTRIKRDVTSSIARVTSKEFNNLPLPSFEQALQGRAAGVFINGGSGKLGQGLKIRVRGISSISADQQPFVVVDGVPIVSQSLGSNTEPDNPLATINPDDIESIEVLKDAASAAIYGSRASNGVLLVTTKSGKLGRTKVNGGFYNKV